MVKAEAPQAELDAEAAGKSQKREYDHAALHARPRVEWLGTAIRDCDYNDCMVFSLRNNWHLTVTEVKITIYPRDRRGNAFVRCG